MIFYLKIKLKCHLPEANSYSIQLKTHYGHVSILSSHKRFFFFFSLHRVYCYLRRKKAIENAQTKRITLYGSWIIIIFLQFYVMGEKVIKNMTIFNKTFADTFFLNYKYSDVFVELSVSVHILWLTFPEMPQLLDDIFGL